MIEDSRQGNTSDPTELLAQKVYTSLREAIIRGRYAEGQRLPEARLAAELNVSRVPLREALPELANQGFLTSLPRRTAVVATWSERTVEELFDVRLSLEVSAARLAARNVKSGMSVDAVRHAINASTRLVGAADPLLIAESSTVIHERFVELSDNALLTSLMRTVMGRMTWLFYMTSQRDAQVACDEHLELLDVICSGNEGFAESVAYAHIEKGRIPSLETLQRVAN